MTWNIVRDLLILEYETPAHDRYLDCPNFFITLKHSPVAAKIEALLTNYLSQKEKHSFGKETFVSLLQIGGWELLRPRGMLSLLRKISSC